MSTHNTIRASITAIDGEIERLTEARTKLAALLDTEDTKPARKQSSSRRTAAVENTVKRSRSPRSTASKRVSKRSNGNGEGESRRDQIVALLDEGLSAREIGDELGIAPNYVYHVKRSLAAA